MRNNIKRILGGRIQHVEVVRHVEIVDAELVALDPSKQYLLLFSRDQISVEGLARLSKGLKDKDIHGIAAALEGGKPHIQVIEACR
jgi:hypothetical protein